jgi:hypothetical protein
MRQFGRVLDLFEGLLGVPKYLVWRVSLITKILQRVSLKILTVSGVSLNIKTVQYME